MTEQIARPNFSDGAYLSRKEKDRLRKKYPAEYQGVSLRRFTVDEYMNMAEAGILTPEDRVELIDGMIVEMALIGRPHERRVNRIAKTMVKKVPDEIEVCIQGTVHLNISMAPEPDVALLSPEASLDGENIPRSEGILLIIEVADSSLRYDRGIKAQRYAQNGIPELWIFVLADDEIEVCRQPTSQGYAEAQRYRRGDALTVQALPEVRFAVDELLQ